jgi:hypothetical protein
MLDIFVNYYKTNNKVVIKQAKNKPSSKQQKMKNKQMKKWTNSLFFSLLFFIINH